MNVFWDYPPLFSGFRTKFSDFSVKIEDSTCQNVNNIMPLHCFGKRPKFSVLIVSHGRNKKFVT